MELAMIRDLWEEIFQITRETGRYPVLPQQEVAVFFMAKVALCGNLDEKRRLQEMVIEVREEKFKIFLFIKNWVDEAFEQLEKGMVLAQEIKNQDLFDKLIETYFRNINELKKIL